ncbi:MAG: AAA family ATPase [Candidatus Dormibacteria bacterium]
MTEPPACPSCGEPLPEGARFCFMCGAPLASALAERRVVTALFCDLVDSVGLGARLDPEHLSEVTGRYFAMVRAAVEAEGGTVEKYIGDAAVALFGKDVAHEDDADRAVRAGLAILNGLQAINDGLAFDYGLALQVRIGINTGEVLSSGAQVHGAVVGDVMNVAARLQQTAPPGEMRASSRTAMALRDTVLEASEEVLLKGVPGPVATFRPAGREAPSGNLDGHILGRSQELARLWELFRAARATRRPHLITLIGEAGVGKTKLLAEFTQEVARHAPVTVTRCSSHGLAAAYAPLEPLIGDWREAGASPREVQHRVSRHLIAALGREAETSGAVVLAIDDLHWADGALLEVLSHLAEAAPLPALVITTSRPGFGEGSGGWLAVSPPLKVTPLNPEAAAHLAAELLGGPGGRSAALTHLRRALLARSGGNPFYLRELVRHAIASGAAQPDGAGPGDVGTTGTTALPDTLTSLLAARIDTLSLPEKRTLLAAAVVGRSFWIAPIAMITDRPAAAIESSLERLVELGFIEPAVSPGPTDSHPTVSTSAPYRFEHVLMRDAAYNANPRRDRHRAHLTVADWLESEGAGESHMWSIAHHLHEAYDGAHREPGAKASDMDSLRTRALNSNLTAASLALADGAGDQAITLSARALDLVRTDSSKVAALEIRGRALVLVGRPSEAWRCLTAAADIRSSWNHGPGTSGPEGNGDALAMTCAEALEVATRWRAGLVEPLEQSEVDPYLQLGLASASPGTEVHARLLTARAFWPMAYPGDADESLALAAGAEAAQLASKLGRPVLESAALDAVGAVHFAAGRWGETESAVQRRLELAPSIDDPSELVDIYNIAAITALMIGRYTDAAARAEMGVAQGRQLRGPGRVLQALASRGMAHFELNEWEALENDISETRILLGDAFETPPASASNHYACAALALDHQGRAEDADRLLDMIEWGRLGSAGQISPVKAPYVAMVMIRRGNLDDAHNLLSDSGLERKRLGWGQVLRARAELLRASGDPGGALRLVDDMRDFAAWAGLEILEGYALRLRAWALHETGHPGADDALRSARAIYDRCCARWELSRSESL